MDVFYSLIHMPGTTTPELEVLDASSLTEALGRLSRVASDWPGLKGLDLYCCHDLIDSFGVEQLRHNPTAMAA